MSNNDIKRDSYRIFQLAKDLEISPTTIVDFLNKNGFKIENNPNGKLSKEQSDIIFKNFKISSKKNTTQNQEIEPTQHPLNIREKEENEKLTFKYQDFSKEEKYFPEKTTTLEKNTIITNQDENFTKTDENASKVVSSQENEFTEKRIKVLGQLDLNNEKFNQEWDWHVSQKKQQELKIKQQNEIKNKQQYKNQNFKNFTEEKKYDKKENLSQKTPVEKNEKWNIINKNTNFNIPKKTNEEIKKARNEYAKIKKEKVASRLENSKEEKDNILHVSEFVTAKALAGLLNESIGNILKKCLDLDLNVTINQKLDKEIISIIAEEFGKKVTFEEVKINVEEDSSEDNRKFKKRNPIVTIMGHVDHGKTTLLDYIRKSNVAKYEKGGITQHIGAYKITTKNNIGIVFVDTPGHEAFTAMRSRGCDITDIIVIIIAADDGVKPQTEEALNQAKSSGKPIIFAINKIDKEGANIEKVKEDLAKLNFLVEDWGGKYQCQGISAKTGQGVEELLEKINLEAELMELKAHFEGKAKGVVLESSLEKGKGYINNLLIQDGELKLGDIVLAGNSYGKVKSIINDNGQTTKYAYPSDPVRVVGLNSAARSGEKFFVIEDEKKAKMLAEEKIRILREQTIHTQNRITLKDLEERAKKGEYNNINIIIRGDVDGSIQALADALFKLSKPNFTINIISNNVSEISDSDVDLAVATKSIIIGFNKKPLATTLKLASEKKIEIRSFSIIYEVIDYISEKIAISDKKEEKEIYLGKAKVIALFKHSKVGMIAGCLVLEGPIHVNDIVKIFRNNELIFQGQCSSLRHFKSDALEIKAGLECGISIKGFKDFQINDILEFYKKE